uniref:Similar to GAUT1/LGT1 (Galacturonosyltransferase 1) n=1 Tax=Arundo donax TaxID=35708 RepID=A0A0A9F8C9_ARUDO
MIYFKNFRPKSRKAIGLLERLLLMLTCITAHLRKSEQWAKFCRRLEKNCMIAGQ